MSIRLQSECRACGGPLQPFLALGDQPLANRLPRAEDADSVPAYPLTLCRCETCELVQLREVVDSALMFSDYAYVPSTSSTMRAHFDELAASAISRLSLGEKDLVIDVGSNDGLLLSRFHKRGVQVLGIEAAANLVDKAVADGIPTVQGFFNANVARGVASYKQASLVTATNVFAHVHDIRGFLAAAFDVLTPDGVFVIEVQSFADTVASLAFDMTYHEHMTYYATAPLARLCESVGFALLDVERVETHGGSLRAYIGRPGHPLAHPQRVAARVQSEREWVGAEACARFAAGAQEIRRSLPALVRSIRVDGGRVAGYGAPAKATVLLNYCRLTGSDIDYVVDRNPAKQGRIIPGTGIPTVGPDTLDADPPTHLLLLAWNLRDEIMREQSAFRASGGQFLVPLPDPSLVAAR
ncbi:MAG TPA: class I SAM-dependent methyltransferase [Gemmatimonadaceae bacterium]|nr:class I SAM-dependent methyltransferase [Gemmatimonadaceae bacterium]